MTMKDTINSYVFRPIKSKEEQKKVREYYSLAVLRYAFPDMFSGLRKREAPDLQDENKGMGVEVTWGGSENDEQITGESIKYDNAKTEGKKSTNNQKTWRRQIWTYY